MKNLCLKVQKLWVITKHQLVKVGALHIKKDVPVLTHPHGGKQEMNVINESGLYHLVMISRKPEAKAFRKWVTSEVLPSIRQNGFYVHPSVALSKAQCKKMDDQMRGLMKEFLTDRDLMRCARATGNAFRYVKRLLDGWGSNPGVMEDLQRRALENKEQEVESPCSVERMRDVIEALSK